MILPTKSSNDEHSKGKAGKEKDPRHIITPDAFTVDEQLLGLSLATPKRRAAAMGLDLLIIQQLSQVDSLFLGFSIVLILVLLSRAKGRNVIGSFRAIMFKIMAAALLLYIVVFETWQYSQTNSFSFFSENESTDTVIEKTQANETQLQSTDNNSTTKELLTLAHENMAKLEAENRVLKANEDSDIMDIMEAMARKFGYGFGWAGAYFTLFVYLLNGQTPGKFLFRIKIIQLDGCKLTIWNSFGRYGGYAASVVTGLSGFFQIFWDPNRQGLHDKVAGTVVIRL